jgi:hypothetical protein
MLNSFWWGGGNQNNGIRCMARERLTCPNSQGGMGFRDFRMFNQAMLTKQGSNIVCKQQSWLARTLKERYFPHSSYLDSKLGHNPSYSWRSIWTSRNILMDGC